MKIRNFGPIDRFIGAIENNPLSDRLILRILFFTVVATGIFLLFTLNGVFSNEIATRGGSITEGVIGTPRFINPALALTRADQDVTALVYGGLMKIDSDGSLVPNIAESIIVSEDGLTYNIVLRKDVQFHDETPLTSSDVIYTINLVQDPELKSPLRGNWNDVLVEEIGQYEINIILEEAYSPFIENFTLGIMPEHLWSNLPIEQLPFSQLNTIPIGTGPFKVINAKRDTSGLINEYTLSAHKTHSDPKIERINLKFYQNEVSLIAALEDGDIAATAYLSNESIDIFNTKDFQFIEEPLPRVFGIFFNQNKSSALRDASVREALSVAVDREHLIDISLHGHGVPISSPTTLWENKLESNDNKKATSSNIQKAQEILEEAGWNKNDIGFWEKKIDDSKLPLEITIRTANTQLFDSVASTVVEDWRELGVSVVVEQFEQADLVQSVIRPRDFQALLFGIDMSRSHDLYPFWHSSQKGDPGLNITQYTNLSVDSLLEDARTEQNPIIREEHLTKASRIITKELPAIFLFQPTLVYTIDADVRVVPVVQPGKASDRFTTISDWHTDSDSLWSIFNPNLEN